MGLVRSVAQSEKHFMDDCPRRMSPCANCYRYRIQGFLLPVSRIPLDRELTDRYSRTVSQVVSYGHGLLYPVERERFTNRYYVIVPSINERDCQ